MRSLSYLLQACLVWIAVATVLGILYINSTVAILANIIFATVLIGLAVFLRRSQCEQQEESLEEDVDETIDPAMVQQWSRVNLPSGGERIDAVMRVDFAAGQQTASLHLPLCPPFSQPLAWELSTLDAADVSLNVAKSLTSGVRIDVKRKAGQPAATHWVLASGTESAG